MCDRSSDPVGPVRIRSANCRAGDHGDCLGMVEQDVPGLGITDCLCDCHPMPAPTPDTTEATLRAALDAIPTVALSYPKGPKYIEHDEDCAFAYGNTTYNCHCFVRLSAVRAALQQPAVQPEPCGWDTRRGDGPIGGPCVLPVNHDGPHAAVQPEGGPD